MLRKIQALVADVEQPFDYGNVFTREVVRGVERLRIALDDGHQGFIRTVASRLTGPFQLLYVLHTSRTDAELGRYESPELNAEAVHVFLDRFGGFLSEDGRHDLWVRSHGDDATIVWDRHNLIFAYGPLNVFESALLQRECGQARRRRFLIRTCITTTSNGTPKSAQYSKRWPGTSNRFANRMCSLSRRRASPATTIFDAMARTMSG